MPTTLSPLPVLAFRDNNGNPLSNGLLYTYSAGTTTPLVTYTDSTGLNPNPNPVVLNPRGEAQVWLPPNVAYKYVLTDSGNNTIWTVDQIVASQLLTLFGGIDTGATNAYILTFAATFSSYTNGIVVYWVPANNNAGPSTLNINGLGVIPIVNPNGTALGANQIVAGQMTGVIYYNGSFQLISVGNFTGATIGTFGTETAIASAATTDLGSALAHVVQVTGTTTITSFGSSASLSAPIYMVRFSGALTLTYNSTSLILPGAASITTSAGDALVAQYLGAGAWKVLIYQYAAGNANTKIKPADTVLVSNASVATDPDLQSNILAVGRYAFEIYLVFDSVSGAAGFQWTNGGTAVDSRALAPALASGFVNSLAYGPKTESPYANTIVYAAVGTGTNSNAVLYKGSLLVSTPGTFGVSWAQNTSTASATTLRAGSYLTITQINVGTSATQTTHTYNSGSGTETIPAGFNKLTLEVWGGGGGGGAWDGTNGGGGGGGGGYSRSVLTVTGLSGQTINYVVGAGGIAGAVGNASSCAAGTFSMTTMTANGGTQGGAAFGSPGSGGPGGTATGGTTANTTGNSGSAGSLGAPGSGGSGISGVFGSGGAGGRGQGIAGSAIAGFSGLIIFTYST